MNQSLWIQFLAFTKNRISFNNFLMITVFFFCCIWKTFATELCQLMIADSWCDCGFFNAQNLIQNQTDYSSLSIIQHNSSQWALSSTISWKNITSNDTVLKPTFLYKDQLNLPLNSNSSLILNISINGTLSNNVSMMADVVFQLVNDTRLIIMRYGSNLNKLSNAIFSNRSLPILHYYSIQSGNALIQQDNSNNFSSRYFNAMEILNDLCTIVTIPCSSEIKNMYYQFSINTSDPSVVGQISFSTSVKMTNCTGKSFSQQGFSHNFSNTMLLQPFIQYGKVCRPSSSPAITQYKFEYKFLVHYWPTDLNICPFQRVVNFFIQVYTYFERGQHSGVLGDNLTFPINNTQQSILSTFSIWMFINTSSIQDVKAEACYVLILRQDLGGEAQVHVCLWSNVHISNYNVSLQIGNISCTYYNYSFLNKHFFIIDYQSYLNENKSLQRYDLNLSQFVEYVTELQSYRTITVRRGFRIFCGRISFKISSDNFLIKNNTQVFSQNLPNTQNTSNTSTGLNLINNNTLPQPLDVSESVKSTVGGVVSVPNVGMLLRLAQLLNTLDDLSYFVYHNTTYDAAFENISDLSWGWTHSKWLPPSLIQNFINVNLSSSYEPGWVPFRQPVARFRIKGERMAFLDNCKGFLFYTVPSSLILFVILWKIYWQFKDNKAAAVLTSFSSWAYLAVSLVCDNGQYIAFRSFEQLRSFQPMSGLGILSQILAVIALFLAVICSCGLFLMAHSIACNSFKPLTLLRFIPSYKFLGIWTASRFVAGFAHAIVDNPLLRIQYLLFLQFIIAVSTLLSCHCTRFKTPHIALVIGQLTRFVLYSLVCLEVAFPQLVQNKSINVSDITVFLIQIIFVATALQIILTIIVGLLVVPQDLELKKKPSYVSPVSSALKSKVEQQKLKVKKSPWLGRRVIKIGRNRNIVEITDKVARNSDMISSLTKQPISSQVKQYSPKIKQIKDSDLYLIKKYKHQIAIKHMKADQKRRQQIENKKLKM